MNLRTRLLAVASAAAIFAGLGLSGAVPAGAAHAHPLATFNVANDKVTCNTLTGTITFATALTSSGPTTGANTITVKGAVAGCTDTSNSSIGMFTGTLATTISSTNGHNCTGLLGPSNITGSAQIVWKPATGQTFTPTTTVGSSQKPASNISFRQVSGGTFTVPASESPWSSTYGKFSIGSAYGTLPLATTVDFTGGDGGATGWFDGTTQQDLGDLLGLCGGKGIKTVTFGIGAVTGA
jgi:hypothetical protein